MFETLYRKYRPKNFSEVIGQQHVVRTLSNAIISSRTGHAYLFTGPRGTGKTSIARILAKTVNCTNLKKSTPCEKCQSCRLIGDNRSLDIIEIDAASNTGVDNIRELRETVALPPTSLKYKVYIIDEVHMLSSGAFNALLKTLEEPPSHVIFILATTEIHKVPETIISRCQRFDFTRLPIQNIIEKLSFIAKTEKIKIGYDALEMIAIAAEGGMRDAESLLNQIIALEDKDITAIEVEEILGTTSRALVTEAAEKIINNDSTGAISLINKIMEDGYDLLVFNKALINNLRQLMLLKINPELQKYFTYELAGEQLEKMAKIAEASDLTKIIRTINLLLEAQNRIGSFILPQLPLEMAIIRATQTLPDTSGIRNQESGGIKDDNSKFSAEGGSASGGKIQNLKNENDDRQKTNNIAVDLNINDVKSKWNKLLSEIRPYNHSLNALLANCKITEVAKNEITIATPYEFYKERLNENGNRLTIEEVFSKILGTKIIIKTAIDKNILKEDQNKPAKNSDQDSLLSSAMEIMGGKVVEE